MAIRFDSTDRLDSTTSVPVTTTWTMMGWFKISVDTNNYAQFFSIGGTIGEIYALETAVNGTTLQIWNASSETNGSVLTVGTWYHLAMTCAGTGAGQMLGYLNGVLDITTTGTAGTIASQRLTVAGSASTGTYPLNGCVQDFFVYDAVLTIGEIVQQMQQRFPIRTSDLNRWTPCMIEGDAATDYSGNGRNWTVGGTLATEDAPGVPWSIDEQIPLIIEAGVTLTASPSYIKWQANAINMRDRSYPFRQNVWHQWRY